MRKRDARHLSPDALDALRHRVMDAVAGGMLPTEAARTFGVSRQSIYTWLHRVRVGGTRALRSRPRGRPPQSQLKPHQAATTVRLIADRCPDQIKLPFALWTREAVRDLIAQRWGVHVSVWTVGRYLRRWNFTPQTPLRRAYERDPEAVRRWLEEEYPAIRKRAHRAGAVIFWGDEMGVRSDHHAGRSWGRRGQTPVVPSTGQRCRCNMISAVTNRGHLAFLVFKRRFTGPVFLTFVRRLMRHAQRPVFLIVDGHPVHRSTIVKNWVARQGVRLRLFFLPGYSPELNPDEYLNNEVKANGVGRKRPHTEREMIHNVRGYLRRTQRQPTKVRRYFHHPAVRYAALRVRGVRH